jgi:hypothetical protein
VSSKSRRVQRGGPEWQGRVDAYMVEVRDRVARFGWAIQGVFDNETGLNFAYTVGLTARRQPELVATGAIAIEYLSKILNAAAPLNVTGNQTEVTVTNEDGEHPVVLRVRAVTANSPNFRLGTARRLYGSLRVAAVQLLWPSDDGTYPDDDAWDPGIHGRQPLLPARARR